MEDNVKVVYVRFDHNLDYKSVVNSFYIKKFLESVFGELPTMATPKKFTFDRDKLGEFIQDQYLQSRPFIVDTKVIPDAIDTEYHNNTGEFGERLLLVEFEPEVLTDDHLVTVNLGDKVLGVFATEDDFGKIVNEMILQNIPNTMDVEDQEEFDKFCEYANKHIDEFL